MPEIKHDFSAGKMNKDLDERIVPNGEYRDATNIQVRTTDSDGGIGGAGAVQNIKGNRLIKAPAHYDSTYGGTNSESKIITSIGDEKNNKAYFFLASPNFYDVSTSDLNLITERKKYIDTIIEVDTGTGTSEPISAPVVVDVWGIIDIASNVLADNEDVENNTVWYSFNIQSINDYRIGMVVQAYNTNGDAMFEEGGAEIQDVEQTGMGAGRIVLYTEQVGLGVGGWDNIAYFTFAHPKRVLNFTSNTKITGINIIDDLLFWTDNKTEPKKINITRCKAGSMQGSFLVNDDWTRHTQLKLSNPIDSDELFDYIGDLEVSLAPSVNNDLRLEHVTVIRKAPLMAPTIHMKRTDRELQSTSVLNFFYDFAILNSGEGPAPGDEVSIPDFTNPINPPYILSDVDWREGDILSFTASTGQLVTASVSSISTVDCLEQTEDEDDTNEPDTDGDGIANYLDTDCNDGDVSLTLNILSASPELNYVAYDASNEPTNSADGYWDIELQQRKPLFELKLGRFSCRYKYEDGEYSSFGPWSEIAFLPGPFNYNHKKGFNTGMTNTMRELVIKDFIPHQRTKGADVTAVDILYKTTDNANCYVVKTVTRNRNGEWDLFTTSSPEAVSTDYMFGEFSLTTEMIHKVLPENQLMRSWDNVPKKALGQEIAANRLVYSNYEQGYEIVNPLGLIQSISSDDTATMTSPKKSIKSIRDYKFGMVFGDEFGRETPVIAPAHLIQNEDGVQTIVDGSVSVDKSYAPKRSNFKIEQDWINGDGPDDWISYIKYYIKETSSEYYNLVMDRWYNAEDGNIWLSFISADRNKLDEETYLLLKNEHGSDSAVTERARYKILAIESEAPEFIKADSRVMGRVILSTYSWDWMFSEGYPSNATVSTTPALLMEETEIEISDTAWDGFLENYKPSRGDLQVRVVGVGSAGTEFSSNRWETVTYYNQGDEEGDSATVMWQNPFGQKANMYQLFSDSTGQEVLSELVYYLEFRELVYLDKAEFDGKFFVKIEKDATLESKVLLFSSDEAYWDNLATYNVSYIDNQQYNPSETNCLYCDDEEMPRRNYRWLDDDSVPSTGTSGENQGGENVAPLDDLWSESYDCESSNGEADIGGVFTEVESSSGSFAAAHKSGCFSYDALYLGLGCADKDGISGGPISTGIVGQYAGVGDDDVIDVNGGYGGVNNPKNVVNRAGETNRFWQWWHDEAMLFLDYGNPNTNAAFIDGARAHKVFANESNWICDGPRDPDTGDCIDDPTAYSSTGRHPGQYYKCTGLDQGHLYREINNNSENIEYGSTDGQLGRMMISTLANGDNWLSGWGEPGDPQWNIKNLLTTKNTLFSFTDDPDGFVYQIISDQNGEANGWDDFTDIRSHAELPGATDNTGDNQQWTSDPTPPNNQGDPVNSIVSNEYLQDYDSPYAVGWQLYGGPGLSYISPLSNATTFTDDFCTNEEPSPFADEGYSTLYAIGGDPGIPSPQNFFGDFFSGLYPQNSPGFPFFWYMPGCPFYGRNEDWNHLNFTNHNPTHHNPIGSDTEIRVGGLSGQYGSPSGSSVFDDNMCKPCGTISSELPIRRPWHCKRTGFRVEFRKYNKETLSLEGSGANRGKQGVNTMIWDPRGTVCHDGRESLRISFIQRIQVTGEIVVPISNAAIWETEPKENVGLDIYYEASNAIPVRLNSENTSNFAPYNSSVTMKEWDNISGSYVNVAMTNSDHHVYHIGYTQTHSIVGIKSTDDNGDVDLHTDDIKVGDYIVFNHPDGTQTMAQVESHMNPVNANGDDTTPSNVTETLFKEVGTSNTDRTGYYKLDSQVWKFPVELSWHNCWSFGNGVESDRIRDDYNAPQIDNGVKVSTTFLDYGKERRGSGMIYSGIYNSTAGVNDLNEFNMAEKITKDINPSYGSIQALKTRDTDIVVLTEDKTLKITTNKDALYNADGNPQLIASNRVLGTAVPFSGNYGISNNPESLAFDQYRLYFTDMQRGAVMRLSRDGLTPISEVGMKTWFRENLKKTDNLLGTFDMVNGEYNLTLDYKESESLKDTTISFNERSKGWVSFKSFIPQAGVSIGGKYLTAISKDIGNTGNSGKEKKGIFEHYVDITKTDSSALNFGEVINRNTFYATLASIQCEGSISGNCSGVSRVSSYFGESSLTVMFNDAPDLVKSFKAINYEGSQAKTDSFTATPNLFTDYAGNPFGNQTDGEYYNLYSKKGWYVNNMITDLSLSATIPEFIEKEGKWFNRISGGERNTMTNMDLNEFSVQGLAQGPVIINEPTPPPAVKLNINSDMIDDTTNPFLPLADNNE